MSVEDKHYVHCPAVHLEAKEIAGLRQELYDAKLALSQGDQEEATRKIIEALDRTTKWTP